MGKSASPRASGASTNPIFKEMLDIDILTVGRELGLRVWESTGASAGSMECPACGAETRHRKSHDTRGAIGVAPDGRARCFQCEEGFDAVKLVAFALEEGRYGAKTFKWCRELLDDPQTPRRGSAPTRALAYPDEQSVRQFWHACAPLGADARAYLEGRRISGSRAIELDMVRQLPRECVHRAPWSQAWALSGHTLIFPMFDEHGVMRSVLARLPRPPLKGERKSLAMGGYSCSGLTLACPAARAMLVTGSAPQRAGGDNRLCVVLAEGEIDSLAWACYPGIEVDAVFGIRSGAFTAAYARRIPGGAVVIVATHRDPAGEGLAAGAFEKLREAKRDDLVVRRWAGGSP